MQISWLAATISSAPVVVVTTGGQPLAICRASKLQNIVKALEDLDKLAFALPQILSTAKSQTISANARAIGEMSELVRLEIMMDKSRARVEAAAFELLALIKRTSNLTSASRANQHARISMALAERLASQLHALLRQWAAEPPQAEAA